MRLTTAIKIFSVALVFSYHLISGNCAQAAIERSQVNLTVDLQNPYFLDINNDNEDDFKFMVVDLGQGLYACRVNVLSTKSFILDSSEFGFPNALNYGVPVSGLWNSNACLLGSQVGGATQFEGMGKKYLGLKLVVNNKSFLAWVLLEVDSSCQKMFLYDAAYNNVGDEAFFAGQLFVTGIKVSAEDSRIEILQASDAITINCSAGGAYLSVYDLSGRLILADETKEERIYIQRALLPAGICIVKVQCRDRLLVKKLFL